MYELRETHPAGSLRKSTARLLALVFTLSLCLQQVWAAPEARTVIPLGKAVGIKLFADGALVVGLSEDGPCPARDCGLKEAKSCRTTAVNLWHLPSAAAAGISASLLFPHRGPMARGSWGRGYATAWPVSAR